jgi:hypothetical protein
VEKTKERKNGKNKMTTLSLSSLIFSARAEILVIAFWLQSGVYLHKCSGDLVKAKILSHDK